MPRRKLPTTRVSFVFPPALCAENVCMGGYRGILEWGGGGEGEDPPR